MSDELQLGLDESIQWLQQVLGKQPLTDPLAVERRGMADHRQARV